MNADQWKEFRNMCEHHYWGSLEIHKKLILDNIDGVIRSFKSTQDQPGVLNTTEVFDTYKVDLENKTITKTCG